MYQIEKTDLMIVQPLNTKYSNKRPENAHEEKHNIEQAVLKQVLRSFVELELIV